MGNTAASAGWCTAEGREKDNLIINNGALRHSRIINETEPYSSPGLQTPP